MTGALEHFADRESLDRYLTQLKLAGTTRAVRVRSSRDIQLKSEIEKALLHLEPGDRIWIELLFGIGEEKSTEQSFPAEQLLEDEKTKRILRELRRPSEQGRSKLGLDIEPESFE